MIPGNELEKTFMYIEELHKEGFVFTGVFMDGVFKITETQALQKEVPPVEKQTGAEDTK